jgi:DNA processing protein
MLANLEDPPPVLYAQGNVDVLRKLSVAVIGTRRPSKYGSQCGQKLAAGLARDGIAIVSGLAEGCDTAGHLGALDSAGATVAVLAHGLDTIYPASNKDLAARIVAEGGERKFSGASRSCGQLFSIVTESRIPTAEGLLEISVENFCSSL